ncbi:hypothetical protein [Enterobacter phage EC152]
MKQLTTFWCPHLHKTEAVVEGYVTQIECSCCGLQAKTQKPLVIDVEDGGLLSAHATSGSVVIGSSSIPSWMYP